MLLVWSFVFAAVQMVTPTDDAAVAGRNLLSATAAAAVGRAKRQEPTSAPVPVSTGIYSSSCPTDLFRRMDKCCRLPQLYPTEALNRCTGRNLLAQLPRGPRKNIRPVQVRLRRPLTNVPRNASIKARVEDICKVHCIFKYQKWLAAENYVDENLLYSSLAIIFPPGPWQSLITNNYVRTECQNMATYGEFAANVTNAYGNRCMVAPFRLLRCIKRSMLLAFNSCPSSVAQNQQCDLDRNYLRLCDVYSV